MRWFSCVAVWVFGASAVVGEDAFALKSTVETGWTSNATETTDGPSDLFVEHEHELSLTGAIGALSLRGTLLFEQTRFATISVEDDMSAAAGVEATLELDKGMALRAGYAVTRDWIGEGLPLDGTLIGIAGGKVTHETMLELAVAGADQQVSMTVNGSWRYPEKSVISGLPIVLPPVRLDPEVGVVGVGVNWEKAVSSTMAVLGRLKGDFSNVPEDDQIDYVRLPGTAGTAAGGIRAKEGNLFVEFLAGATMVWPLIDPALREVLPYLAMQSEIALSERWSVALRAEKRVELDDPLDPVASGVSEVELSARYRMTDAISLSAAISRSDEAGIFDPSQTRQVQSASLRLDYVIADQASLSLAALRKWVEASDGDYAVDRYTLAINTQF
ncbi:hypothetical protein [Devosia sp. Root685]|uniref:hypothetical protein n=1 Tax=Devosia sp. Root685 TaxID=1736587 RepID=UPI000AC10F91|nr:hypothetical protein [Devosia sp. Root685]